MLVVQCERGADSFPPPPSSFPLPLTQSSVWSVTQHAALPQPNGAIIKNDRNLFLATKQAEATDVSSQKKELFTPRPPEPQENLLCQNWDCLKLTGCEKEFWSWVGKGRRDVQWNGRKFQGFFFLFHLPGHSYFLEATLIAKLCTGQDPTHFVLDL